MTRHHQGLLFLILVTLTWGLSFCLVKAMNLALPEGWGSAAALLCVRFALAALPLIVWLALSSRRMPTRLEWRQGLLLAFLCGTGMLLQAHGLSYTLASTSAFLTQGCAVLVPIWLAIRHRHFPPIRILLPLFLVVAGVFILSGFEVTTFRIGRGETETLLSCLFFTAMILVIEAPRYESANKLRVTAIFLAMGSLGALPVAWMFDGTRALELLMTQGSLLGINFTLALVSTSLAFYWMIRWQPAVTATEAGIIYCLEPVWASAFSLLLPTVLAGWASVNYENEQLTFTMLLGGGLILFASMLLAFVTGKEEGSL